jgi:hypothetical protein
MSVNSVVTMRSSNSVESCLGSSLCNSFSFHTWVTGFLLTRLTLHPMTWSNPEGDKWFQPASALHSGNWDLFAEKEFPLLLDALVMSVNVDSGFWTTLFVNCPEACFVKGIWSRIWRETSSAWFKFESSVCRCHLNCFCWKTLTPNLGPWIK